MKPFTIPSTLKPLVDQKLSMLRESFESKGLCFPIQTEIVNKLSRIFIASDYVSQYLIKHPDVLLDLLAAGDLEQAYSDHHYHDYLQAFKDSITDEVVLAKLLRKVRHREMMRIIWRDLLAIANVKDTLLDLSRLADALIQFAHLQLYTWYCKQFGTPLDADGDPQMLIILALGKLGGNELNLSSDVDLVFIYPEWMLMQQHPRVDSSEDFFTRLTQALIKQLSEVSADGFVYRVDTRLKPFGNTNKQLVISVAELENYYQQHGREWERYALIKSRVISNATKTSVALLAMLQKFVYRRYIDFSVIDALRELKQIINRENKLKNMQHNIKRGAGGIREIEFIAQATQLIRGGQETSLRVNSLMTALAAIAELQLLPLPVVEVLTAAYQFLRRLENALQAYADQQTHQLPTDTLIQQRIAIGLGYLNWDSLFSELKQWQQQVELHFQALFGDQTNKSVNDFNTIWLQLDNRELVQSMLQEQGYQQAIETLRNLQLLQQLYLNNPQQSLSLQRLNKLMPDLLAACAKTSDPDQALQHIIPLLETVAQRSVYLCLLQEKPMVVDHLVTLCSKSKFIADELARHPLLLDELLDERVLIAALNKVAMQNELNVLLSRVEKDDLEQQMEILRRFKLEHVLHIAAGQVLLHLSAIDAGFYLTHLAEIILNATLNIASFQLLKKQQIADVTADALPFAIIAYGKLGSNELTYQSDLDLIFLYDDNLIDGTNNPMINSEFFVRLAQRFIHMISTRTALDSLYEVDTRLRPSGSSGQLVSSIKAFAEYQFNHAWIWEHQALIKARFVSGHPALAKQFSLVRQQALSKPHDTAILRHAISEMREQMRENQRPSKNKLKTMPGGLIDIEFLISYWVLAKAAEHPSVLHDTNTLPLLQALQTEKILSDEHFILLKSAYFAFYEFIQNGYLNQQQAATSDQESLLQQQVLQLWHQSFS